MISHKLATQIMRYNIFYVQYTNPACYPSLEHSAQILAHRGWKILFLGTHSYGDSKKFELEEHAGIVSKKISFCRAGAAQKLHYIRFCAWVALRALLHRPRWIYTSDIYACPVSLLLSFFGVKVIYHEHDSVQRARRTGTRPFFLWARKNLAQRSRACVVPNQARVELFRDEVGGDTQIIRVWNCPSQKETASGHPVRGDNEIRLLYHGSIVPSRLPVTVIKAMSMLPDTLRLFVLGYETQEHQGYVKTLEDAARELKIEDRLRFIGSVPARTMLFNWCGKADIGLALMPKRSADTNEQHMAGASNKPFDYLAYGLALLVSDLADWRELYVQNGYALACDPEDPASIADALRQMIKDPVRMRDMGERGRQKVQAEWNYESQFAPVLSILMQ